MPTCVITFDVDGTLIHSVGKNANALHKRAFSESLRDVAGLENASIDEIPHHGSTDRLILLNMMIHRGMSHDDAMKKVPLCVDHMRDFARRHGAAFGDGIALLPGVAETLRVLASTPGVIIGLVTGNVEEVAWAKMAALGIREFFTFGCFGGDHPERSELVRRALAHHAERGAVAAHVGDAPQDIRAALMTPGVKAIGVTTGIFDARGLIAEAESCAGAIASSSSWKSLATKPAQCVPESGSSEETDIAKAAALRTLLRAAIDCELTRCVVIDGVGDTDGMMKALELL